MRSSATYSSAWNEWAEVKTPSCPACAVVCCTTRIRDRDGRDRRRVVARRWESLRDHQSKGFRIVRLCRFHFLLGDPGVLSFKRTKKPRDVLYGLSEVKMYCLHLKNILDAFLLKRLKNKKRIKLSTYKVDFFSTIDFLLLCTWPSWLKWIFSPCLVIYLFIL